MRGTDRETGKLFSYASPESLVPPNHPLRAIRLLVNAALDRLSPTFGVMYAEGGRRSIPPERLLRALLQALFTIRSERQLMQQITYNILFRWFVGLAMDVPVWDVTVFTKNRGRLPEADIARSFLAAILTDPQVTPLLSTEHFSVDGTSIEAWASMKNFRPKDGSEGPPALGRNEERDLHGEKRSNETHASTTGPDARLYKKSPGASATLCQMGHVVMENRGELVVATAMRHATGTAEREAAVTMAEDLSGSPRITLGADKAYDKAGFVAEMRQLGATPHVTQNTRCRRSMAASRGIPATHSACGRVSASRRCSAGSRRLGLRKTSHCRAALLGWMFTLAAAAYNLVRIPKLLAAAA